MSYVHGYSDRETQRLYEQADILEDILHSDTAFPPGARVLEAGCGVGAQTRLLLKRSPQAVFTCIDISHDSLARARRLKDTPGFEQVTFEQADIRRLRFADAAFDHIFVCFVLEHLDNPVAALTELKRVLRPGGTLTLIEGDHGACVWHPETPAGRDAWHGLIAAQQAHGHDPLIGRRLAPLLTAAGFQVIACRPAWLYADRLNPDLRDGMVNHIIVPMVRSARDQILADNLVPPDTFEQGCADIARAADPDGTFFYTWFKALATRQ
jgi:ubiquinone/menaquinone biosynthesis C-methylase UbiE